MQGLTNLARVWFHERNIHVRCLAYKEHQIPSLFYLNPQFLSHSSSSLSFTLLCPQTVRLSPIVLSSSFLSPIMAPLAWTVLLLVLLGHTISATSSYSPSDVSDVDLGLSSNVPSTDAPLDLNDTLTSDAPNLVKRDDNNPNDFGWIRRWAALGDSFTAGIGAGNLYNSTPEDKRCSRYDRSYPSRLKMAFSADADFQYLACSGDRTEQIHAQTWDLKLGKDTELDLVVLTGGGNDLCLVRDPS